MLPTKLENPPVIDSVIEIRFTSKVYPTAVFGIIYNELQKDFQTVEKLPILQLPEQLRDMDPNFKFKPHYKISNQDLSIQIGPDVFVIASSLPYKGWTNYSKKIFDLLDKLFKMKVIERVTRLGLRYVNFFELNIFSNINVSLKIVDKDHDCANTLIRTEIAQNGYTNIVNISNNVNYIINGKPNNGSILDIDTSKVYYDDFFMSDYINEVNTAHVTEKELFFLLLKEDLLKLYNPKYECQ